MAKGIWIRKRPAKAAEVWIVFKDKGGKRHREKIGPDTPEARKLAKQALAKAQVEVYENRYVAPGKRLTFNELADNYYRLVGSNRDSSWRYRTGTLLPEFGPRLADEIGGKEWQEWYNKKVLATTSSTANRYLALIRAIYNRAIEWGDFQKENPLKRIKRQPDNASRLRFLSSQEMDKLLEVCQRPGYAALYPVIVCALFTGMRQAEMLNLDWKNVDLENGTIYILVSKSGKPREVPIADRLRGILLGIMPKAEGPVFEISYMTFRRLFDRLRRESGLPHFRFHDLRHTFASHFSMKTGDLYTLQRLMGHATPQMTQRYAHLSKSHINAAMKDFESAMPMLNKPVAQGEGLRA
ncbi:MAG TPA: site-specific integrase [Elusimicrobiales bacterium]|nr:site-specific integrase [Elusimicrobiales bacterium]